MKQLGVETEEDRHIPTRALTDAVFAPPRRTVFTVDSTSYTINGVVSTVRLEVAPRIVAGRTLLPLRAAANAVGVNDADIEFNQSTGEISLYREGGHSELFHLSRRQAIINFQFQTMEVAPKLVSGRVLLSVRWVVRVLGASMEWNPNDRTITVYAERIPRSAFGVDSSTEFEIRLIEIGGGLRTPGK